MDPGSQKWLLWPVSQLAQLLCHTCLGIPSLLANKQYASQMLSVPGQQLASTQRGHSSACLCPLLYILRK